MMKEAHLNTTHTIIVAGVDILVQDEEEVEAEAISEVMVPNHIGVVAIKL